MANKNEKKVVLVTGAASGIGRATRDIFLTEGWQVIAADKVSVKSPLPQGAHFIQSDLSNPAEIGRLTSQAAKLAPDGLHALVNNAALQSTTPLVDTPQEDWDEIMAVNLRAPFLLAQALYPLLKKAAAAIVNVASVHALATSAHIGAYAASKGGLVALTRSMAIEFAEDAMRVNAVLPGATDTNMLSAGLKRSETELKKSKAALESKILLGRVAQPEEIGRAIYFLADNEQSSYITGQSLVVDGGATIRLSSE
jgi:NAD(P)-dependent dehydrogenase (short-subunit alcohol dehydrogenase family)